MARKPQKKNAGSQVIFTLDDNQVVLDYINGQSNISEGIRFAIEYFVQQQGSFDIQSRVPMRRDISNPAQYLGAKEAVTPSGHSNVNQLRPHSPEEYEQKDTFEKAYLQSKPMAKAESLTTIPERNVSRNIEQSSQHENPVVDEDKKEDVDIEEVVAEEPDEVVIGSRQHSVEKPKIVPHKDIEDEKEREDSVIGNRNKTSEKSKDDLGDAGWLLG
ncbi:hypothetical protein [Priestia koreensis]|uniref:Uncharacterized protein n=1 Tax=Priestia koreensis TaxID=284581 RepID=A0A0M0LAS0_9BACI|nr:hypothetical protein [Priestia koreensis]KOO48151.1 hypothetical protein AMD01_04920 [Priestia koreensis]